MVTKVLRHILLIVICLSFSGCVYGIIYNNTTKPLVRNMDNTPRGSAARLGYSNEIKEPFTAGGLRVEWASRAIGDIAVKNGLARAHYADIQTFSLLSGIFRRRVVTVYGTPLTSK